MKRTANRMIVFTASMIAFGTVAFGQTTAVARIPFEFHSGKNTLPAGTYKFNRISVGIETTVMVENTASGESRMMGAPRWEPASSGAASTPQLEFLCAGNDCTLISITTYKGRLVYAVPHKPASERLNGKYAAVSVPLVKVGD